MSGRRAEAGEPVRYTMATASVELVSDHPAALAWAAEFLPPYFSVATTDAPAGDRVVARFRSSAAGGIPGAGVVQPLFLRRQGRRWHTTDATHILDVNSGDRYTVRAHVVTVDYRHDEPYFRRDPARLVRELAIDQLAGQGALRLHAAAARVGGRGVVVVGAAGSGKSWTVAQLLAAGAGFVGNDRVLLRGTGGSVDLVGVPLAVRWSAPQLRNFAAGTAFLETYDAGSALRQSDDRAGYRKYELTPSEVARISGRPLVARTPLAAVVVADRATPGPPALTPMSRPEGLNAVLPHVLAEDPAFPRFYRCGPAPRPPPDPRRFLPDGVRWYRLTGDPDHPGGVDRLVELLG